MRDFLPGEALCLFAAIAVLVVAKLSGLVLAVASVAALQFVDWRSDRPGKV